MFRLFSDRYFFTSGAVPHLFMSSFSIPVFSAATRSKWLIILGDISKLMVPVNTTVSATLEMLMNQSEVINMCILFLSGKMKTSRQRRGAFSRYSTIERGKITFSISVFIFLICAFDRRRIVESTKESRQHETGTHKPLISAAFKLSE